MSEAKLIQKIKAHPEEFGQVYDTYYALLFNYCYKRLSDFDTAKDICSETFLKAFLNIHKFNYRGISLRSWLYKIASNEIKLYYRSKKYRPSILSEIKYENLSELTLHQASLLEEKANAEAELEKHEQFIKVQTALLQIPLKYQEVISLKYFEGLKIKEISEVLNKPQGTIKSLLSRGLNLLKEKLACNLF